MLSKPKLINEEDATATPKRHQSRSFSHRRSNSHCADYLVVLTTQLYSSNAENEEIKLEVDKSKTRANSSEQEALTHHPALNAAVNTTNIVPVSIIEPLDIKVPLAGLENAREYFATRKPKKSLLALRSDADPLTGDRKSNIRSPQL
jgi:hypothetical protein